MRRARTERPENFEVDLSHPLMRGAVLLGLGQAHHSIRYRDESVKGNHGVLTNMDPATDWLWEPKLGRRALDFDGSNDSISLPGPCLASFAAASASVWVRFSTLPLTGGFSPTPLSVVSGTGTSGFRLIECAIASGDMGVSSSPGASYGKCSAGGLIAVNTWAHLAFTFNGAIALFLNGRELAIAGDAYASIVSNTIGGRSSTTGLITGLLADPCIWPRALSPAEIMQLADPSNVMLSGAIREPRPRRNFVGWRPSAGVRYGGALRAGCSGGGGVRRGGALRGA
jgi:hypothetical protein